MEHVGGGDDAPTAFGRCLLMSVDGVHTGDLVKCWFDVEHGPSIDTVDGDYAGMGQKVVLLLDCLPVKGSVRVADSVEMMTGSSL